MSNKITAVLDLDWVKYTAAGAGEKRSIIVTHKPSGRTKEFANRTEFYGRDKKKSGGWLGDLNSKRTSPFTLDEFEIEDVQTAEPIENVLHTAKLMVEGALERLGTKKYVGYVGLGDSFRVERSTILRYKDGRSNMLKPVHLPAVEEYLVHKFKANVVTGLEADDWVVIESFGKNDRVVVGVDKDHKAQPVRVFNPDHPDQGIIDCNQFGKLWLDDKGEVRGYGEVFLGFQVAYGDDVDVFKAHSASDVSWGKKTAYKALQEVTDPTQLWNKVIEVYKHLYPEPKVITGWRGDEFEIDWKYVINENFTMARMLTSRDDTTTLEQYLMERGINL